MRTVYELMVAVAVHLAEKPVKLRFQHNKGAYGVCRADETGLTTIDIEPEIQFLEERKFLSVFLHEIAHAKNDYYIPMKLELSDIKPVSNSNNYKRKESRADIQAEKWLSYAEKNRKEEFSYFEGCLWTLLEKEEV